MENFWSEFIRKKGGEYNARFEFYNLCYDLLSFHYPGRKLFNANKIEKITGQDNFILVYLPKFFFDALTNSRKSQIRKAFNRTLEIIKDKNIKVFKWILCTPYKFKESDLKWWNQWKYKNFDQHNIEIELIDDGELIDLIEKYHILENDEKIKSSNLPESSVKKITTETSEETDFDLEFELSNQTVPETSLPSANKENEDDASPATSEKQQQKEPSKYPQQPASEQEVDRKFENTEQKDNNYEILLEKYNIIKQDYKRILDSIVSLRKEEKEKFNRLRLLSDFDYNRFLQQPDIQKILKLKILDIYFKAKTYEVDKKYDLALFYYEILAHRKQELKNQFKNKASEVERAFREVEKQLLFEQKILSGDLLLVKDKKLEALENYEDALRINPKNTEARIKYNELLGDMLMESGLYSEAIKAYTEAMDKITNRFMNKKNEIASKRRLAKIMNNTKIPLLAPLFRLLAKIIEIKKDYRLINAHEVMRLNRFLAVSGSVVGILVIFFMVNTAIKRNQSVQLTDQQRVYSIADLNQVAVAKGDRFMQKFKIYGYRRVHVLDSAIKAYHRALIYNRYDPQAVKKYNKAKAYLESYLRLAQRRLKENPGKYYRVVKPMSEGLQLVKYMYDPKNPALSKFGYIDAKHNLVIPPLFDFDYNRRMKPGWESFHNGHAYVCVVVRPGDTAYFRINRFGRRTSKVYFVGPKAKLTTK